MLCGMFNLAECPKKGCTSCKASAQKTPTAVICDTCDVNNGFFKNGDDTCSGQYYSVVSTYFSATKYVSTEVLKYVLEYISGA